MMGLSERRALRVIGMSPSAYRYQLAQDRTHLLMRVATPIFGSMATSGSGQTCISR